jgi:transcriptional antiterminator NusG
MMPNVAAKSWYALQVRVNAEATVALYLRQMGIKEYVPMCSCPPLKVHRGKEGLQTLFPGYVFCSMNLTHGPRLYSIPGIIRIVGTGKTPIPIEDAEIESLRSIVNHSGLVEPWPYLAPGNMIRLIAGPFVGRAGVVVRSGSTRKLVVSLSLLQRSLAITIPPEWVVLENAS